MAAETSVILVAGAWHTEAHLQPALPYLSKYRSIPIRLETSKEHRATIEDNFEPICKAIEAEVAAGRNVCVLGHSVAGISIVGAIARFLKRASSEQRKKLVAVLLLATFVMDPLRSLAEAKWYEIDFDAGTAALVEPAAEVFYNDLTAAEAQPFVDALDPNWVAPPPQELPAWWQEVKGHGAKMAYFLCLRDRAVSPKFQRLEAAEMALPVVELNTSHCPMVDRPQVLADAIHAMLSV